MANGATYENLSTGDLTIGAGGVSNSGTMTLDGAGVGCGGTDDILIRSSVAATQRAWAGNSTFTLSDVDVQDQAGTAAIVARSSANTANNGANWVFKGCGGGPPGSVGYPAIY